MTQDDRYQSTRQVLLDLLEAVQSGGLDNETIAKLHIDAATDKIEAIWITPNGEQTA